MRITIVGKNGARSLISEAQERKLRKALGTMIFVGTNPKRDEWKRMSTEAQDDLLQRVENANRQWIAVSLSALEAVWIKVMDGKVIEASPHVWTQPDDLALFKESERHPFKVPFVFTNAIEFAVEELNRRAA